jgi:geranylgeranyl diphosphate synthase type II
MRLSIRVGAILAGANSLDLVKLSRFAELLGDAYQLSDDLIDLDEDEAIFSADQKTFAGTEGRAAGEMRLRKTIDDAKRILIENFPTSEARSCLVQFADYLAVRRA